MISINSELIRTSYELWVRSSSFRVRCFILMTPGPYSPLHSPAARPSPLTCATLSAPDRPPIPGAADRVFMRRAWVGKWCVVSAAMAIKIYNWCDMFLISTELIRTPYELWVRSSSFRVRCFILMTPGPYSPHHSLAARHSPLTCAATPAPDRQTIPGTADRVFMRRAWVVGFGMAWDQYRWSRLEKRPLKFTVLLYIFKFKELLKRCRKWSLHEAILVFWAK